MYTEDQNLAKAREIVKNLRPIDDTLFRKMFNENKELTQFVLRILLDKPDLMVNDVKGTSNCLKEGEILSER